MKLDIPSFSRFRHLVRVLFHFFQNTIRMRLRIHLSVLLSRFPGSASLKELAHLSTYRFRNVFILHCHSPICGLCVFLPAFSVCPMTGGHCFTSKGYFDSHSVFSAVSSVGKGDACMPESKLPDLSVNSLPELLNYCTKQSLIRQASIEKNSLFFEKAWNYPRLLSSICRRTYEPHTSCFSLAKAFCALGLLVPCFDAPFFRLEDF